MLYADGLRGDRPSLYPTNEQELEDCNALCEKLHNVLGIKMRVVVYWALLKYAGWMAPAQAVTLVLTFVARWRVDYTSIAIILNEPRL
jgi:hypothetical protein